MPRVSKLQLAFSQWPQEDRDRRDEAFRPCDIFDEDRRGTHLSPATRKALQVSYAQYLRFVTERYPSLLLKSPVALSDQQQVSKAVAILYRDGLLIALLAGTGIRRRTVTALRVGSHLVKEGELWTLEIPAEDVKGKRSLDPYLSHELSARIDVYLQLFRCRLPGAEAHNGLWPSNKAGRMTGNAIYELF
jgi:integrase